MCVIQKTKKHNFIFQFVYCINFFDRCILPTLSVLLLHPLFSSLCFPACSLYIHTLPPALHLLTQSTQSTHEFKNVSPGPPPFRPRRALSTPPPPPPPPSPPPPPPL